MKRAPIICLLCLLSLPLPHLSVSAEPLANSTTPAIGNATTPAVGNYTALPITPEWFGDFIDGILSAASEGAARFASLATRAAIRIITAIYGPMVLIGILLWATGFERQLGKRLILGSVILLVVAEGVPLLGI